MPAFSAKSSFLQYCGENKVELLCTLQSKRKVVLHLSTTKFCIKFLLLLALSNILKDLCVYRAINTQNFYFGSSLVCILATTSSKNSIRGRVKILKKEKSAFQKVIPLSFFCSQRRKMAFHNHYISESLKENETYSK